MSYAVMKDGTSWRAVDGPVEDTDDPTKLFPDPETEYFSEGIPPEPVSRPLTPEEVLSAAIAERDALLVAAGLRIAPLQDAVDLGEAGDSEISSLNAWKQYRVTLNRLSTSENWPTDVKWPKPPQE